MSTHKKFTAGQQVQLVTGFGPIMAISMADSSHYENPAVSVTAIYWNETSGSFQEKNFISSVLMAYEPK
jgi:hypothetical protein